MRADGDAPRAAASLVIVRDAAGGPQVLLGKRRQTQVFAPGKFVFPGGSLDAADLALRIDEQLAAAERYPLLHDQAAIMPEALALAAIRETFEETGLLFGKPSSGVPASAAGGWPAYYAHGWAPSLASLSFIARAITPPGRTRRFDARFFLVAASAIAFDSGSHDGEFEELVWLPFAAKDTLNLHGVTRDVIEEAARFLALDGAARRLAPVPFYFQGEAGWQRSLIARRGGLEHFAIDVDHPDAATLAEVGSDPDLAPTRGLARMGSGPTSAATADADEVQTALGSRE